MVVSLVANSKQITSYSFAKKIDHVLSVKIFKGGDIDIMDVFNTS